MATITSAQVRRVLDEGLATDHDPGMNTTRAKIAQLFDIEPAAMQLLFRVQYLHEHGGMNLREATRTALGHTPEGEGRAAQV